MITACEDCSACHFLKWLWVGVSNRNMQHFQSWLFFSLSFCARIFFLSLKLPRSQKWQLQQLQVTSDNPFFTPKNNHCILGRCSFSPYLKQMLERISVLRKDFSYFKVFLFKIFSFIKFYKTVLKVIFFSFIKLFWIFHSRLNKSNMIWS